VTVILVYQRKRQVHPRVECRVRPCVLEEELVANERERLARTFVTRQFPSETAGKVIHRAVETVAVKQGLWRSRGTGFRFLPG